MFVVQIGNMRKISCSRSASQDETPILQRLRHPLEDYDDEETGQEMALQENSSIQKTCIRDSSAAGFSSASTLFVTESELASSWIYKTKKAAASQETLNVASLNRAPSLPTLDHIEEPVKDQLYPFNLDLPRRRSKRTSCCCFFVVLLVIFICGIGILSSIGGVIYLELFAPRRSHNLSHLTGKNSELVSDEDSLTTVHPVTAPMDFQTGDPPILIFETMKTTEEIPHISEDNKENEVTSNTRSKFEETTEPTSVSSTQECEFQDCSFKGGFTESTTASNVAETLITHKSDSPSRMVTQLSFDNVNPFTVAERDLIVSTEESFTNDEVDELDQLTAFKMQTSKQASSKRQGDSSVSTSTRLHPGNLRASIAAAMKRFQTLEFVELPSSRIKEPSREDSRRNPRQKGGLTPEEEEKAQYLDRLRVLMYGS